MLSSTSSSDERAPALEYARLWIRTALLFGALVASAEVLYRSLGHGASVSDGSVLWSIARASVYSGEGRRCIVVVGNSRSQLGLPPEALEEVLPGFRVVMLSIDGARSWEVVRDLCEDDRFDGVILWDTVGDNLGPSAAGGDRRDVDYPRRYWSEFVGSSGIDKSLNCRIEVLLEERLVCLSPFLGLRPLLLRGAAFRSPNYVTMNARRYQAADFAHRQRSPDDPVRRPGIREAIENRDVEAFVRGHLAPLHARLSARGGTIVMLRMPSTGELWQREEAEWPRGEYWDRIHSLAAVPAVHFRDYPEMSALVCPDESHLDSRDARRFALHLGRVLAGIVGVKSDRSR